MQGIILDEVTVSLSLSRSPLKLLSSLCTLFVPPHATSHTTCLLCSHLCPCPENSAWEDAPSADACCPLMTAHTLPLMRVTCDINHFFVTLFNNNLYSVDSDEPAIKDYFWEHHRVHPLFCTSVHFRNGLHF